MTEKWRLVPAADPEAADGHHARGRVALLDGDLATAMAEFQRAGEVRVHPHDEVGIGDVLLAQGRWRAALRRYQRAALLAPEDVLALLGRSQALVSGGLAREAAQELEQRYAGSGDPVLRYYLASTWCSVAIQVRTRDGEEVRHFAAAAEVDECERAARRILELDPGDQELSRGAERLLSDVAAARRWSWRPEGTAVSLAVLAASLGLLLVAVGGLSGNVLLVLAGVLAGSGMLAVIVIALRKRRWQWDARAQRGDEKAMSR